jgi:hypothetical protein
MRTDGRERVRLDGAESPMTADLAWQRVLQDDLVGWRSPWLRGVVNRINSTFGRTEVRRLVAQTQANWLDSYRELLASIRVPKLLLWSAADRHRIGRDITPCPRCSASIPSSWTRACSTRSSRSRMVRRAVSRRAVVPNPCARRATAVP